jgi:acetolactate synthase-1/2/3 large subunit
VLPCPEELGRVYQPELKIVASLSAFADMAAQLPEGDGAGWREWLHAARADYLDYIEPAPRQTRFDPALAFKAMRDILSPDAILTNGAGNYAAWAHRYHQFSHGKSQLAPTSGAMGYGVPAAIAAKLCRPSRQVVCLAGDGCFLMTSQELATAVRHRLAIVFIVFNNGMYATIRMHQEKHHPGRVLGTDLHNPDFVAYARSFGLEATRVSESADFAPALEQALASAASSSRPYLIEIDLDPEMLTPRTTLSAVRRAALGERGDAAPKTCA